MLLNYSALQLYITTLFCSFLQLGLAQKADTLPNKLSLTLEIRPRWEYRDNYIMSANDTILPNNDITQRNRLTFNYQREKFLFQASLQEIHVWYKSGASPSVANINAYELFLEPRINKHLSIRIGRQGVSLDNGRIFSDAPWAQQSRSHEGIRLMYKASNISNDLFALFTRPYNNEDFDERYSPTASHTYKTLLIHYLKYKLNQHFTLTGLNAIDFFHAKSSNKKYERITVGGRIEAEQNNFYATVSAYYQFGENAQLKRIRAYYLQPEFRMTLGKSIIRLGAEILSGDGVNPPSNTFGSFDVLYGVAWKFMGNMNVFTRFPNDLNGKGLVNPYLFIIYSFNPKLSVRSDAHLFYTQYPQIDSKAQELHKYLGFEHDLSFKYKPIKSLEINYGFSYLLPQEEIALLPKVIDANRTALWSYLMVSYNLNIINHLN